MKSLGLITQVFTIGLAIAVALLYIRPTFEEINILQDDIDQYKTQREKIQTVNEKLSEHIRVKDSVSTDNYEKLQAYMPRFVDDVGVLRDVQFIVEKTSMVLVNLQYDGLIDSAKLDNVTASDLSSPPEPYGFTVVAEGTYSQIKDLFSLLEQNHYPLEVHTASVSPLDGGFLSVEIELVTYADIAQSVDEINN